MKKLLVLLLVALVFSSLHAQEIDLDAVNAFEDFRWGVRAFNNGYFNDSLLYFERAMAFDPEDPLYHQWLGRAYYHSGYEEAALGEWDGLVEKEEATASLINLIRIIRQRRAQLPGEAPATRYVPLYTLEGSLPDFDIFLRPTAVEPDDDGGFYLAGYVSNEILRINANGAVKNEFDGGLSGFDRPFDMEVVPGGFFVTEYQADRIAFCNEMGFRQFSFGQEGEGAVLGPQYITLSDDGFLYISDWGNRRIVKYNQQGDFVLSLGERSSRFEGLRGPAGLVTIGDTLYVADNVRNVVYLFDSSGNPLGERGRGQLEAPEGLALYGEDELLVSSGTSLYRLDPATDSVELFTDLSDDNLRIMGIGTDANGHLVVPDFDRNTVTVLTTIESMYTGLFVRINRINADNFPDIYLDITVEDALGNPVVGLDDNNFYVSEPYGTVSELEVVFSGYLSERRDVSLLLPRTQAVRDRLVDMQPTVEQLAQSGWNLSLVSSGDSADLEAISGDSFFEILDRIAAETGPWEDYAPLDAGIRRAAAEMIPGRNYRSVVCLYAGDRTPYDFENYGLVETARYLDNNSIEFSVLYFDRTPNDELEYLVRETGGVSLYLDGAEGVRPLEEHTAESGSGNYTLKYTSRAEDDFGKNYIEVSVESFLVTRSGRDELGYFSPLR